jgi:hypothetical protein
MWSAIWKQRGCGRDATHVCPGYWKKSFLLRRFIRTVTNQIPENFRV